MTEELYIIDGIHKRRLDLNSPSGITLKFQSNIFGDLSKITASYSYTFKLPRTANNKRLLDMADDVRHQSSATRTKHKAEFYQDGSRLFGDGNLYVDAVQDSYECVMTWDVCVGFESLKDNDINLCELKDWGYMTRYAGEQKYIEEFSNTANALNPMYGCGILNVWSVMNVISNKNFPPLPVVPVLKLIQMINSHYGTRFNLGEAYDYHALNTSSGEFRIEKNDIINRGVLPFKSVTRDEDDVAKEISVINDFGVATNSYLYGDQYIPWEWMGIDLEELKLYDQILFKLTAGDPEQLHVASTYLNYKANSFCNVWAESGEVYGGTTFEMDGYIIAAFGNVTDVSKTELALKERPKLTLYRKLWQPDSDNPTTGKYVADSVTSIEGEDYNYMDSSNPGLLYYIFDFRLKMGRSRLKVEAFASESLPFFFGFNLKTKKIQGEINAIPIYTENTNLANGGYDINIVKNLPDISCLTFMKSLFYMLGAFPAVNKDGEVVPIYFSDLADAIESNEFVDWSGKTYGETSKLPSKVAFAVSGFGRKNYYLMKSDSPTASNDEDETDVYADGKGCIVVDSEVLDATKTIIQLPYNAPYIEDKNNPGTPTGDTFKCWTMEYDSDGYKLKFSEPKPCFGIIVAKPERKYKGSGDLLDETNYEPTGKWFEFMEAWNGFADMANNKSYAYLQKIMAKPIVITENLRLNNVDLMQLDYSKPIYLGKYNAFFAIVSVQRDSKGKCKVELIKLPQ